MKTITFTGDGSYHSSDPWNDGKAVDLAPGQSASVSDEKAAQMLRDFPGLFKGDAPKPKADKQPAKPATKKRGRLGRRKKASGGKKGGDGGWPKVGLSHKLLDELAAGHGVEFAEGDKVAVKVEKLKAAGVPAPGAS